MKCPFCGNEIINENASFCNMCGKKLPQSRNEYYERSNDRSQDELYKETYGKSGDGLYDKSYADPYDRRYGSGGGYVPPGAGGHVPPTPATKDRSQANILKGIAIGLSIAIFCLAAFIIFNAVLGNNKRRTEDGSEANTVEGTSSNKADHGDDQQAGKQTDQSEDFTDTDISSDTEEGDYDEAGNAAATDDYDLAGNDEVTEEDEKNYNFPSNVIQDPSTDHHYAFYNYDDEGLGDNFDEWERFCEVRGGHLATITSQEENDFIYQYLRDNGKQLAFFGYTDKGSEGNWRWVNGEKSSYENWASGQPNDGSTTKRKISEDYAQFSKDTLDGRWNDARIPQNSYLFICEWEY